MTISKFIICFLTCFGVTEICYSQSITIDHLKTADTTTKKENWERKVIVNSPGRTFPITRDTLNQFPDSIIVQARMVDYTPGVSCGYLCGCGSLKLELLRKNDIYKQNYVYVAIPCLNVLPRELKKVKRWILYKLPMYVDLCYFTEVPMNKFDTKGVAFYTLTNYNKKE